MPDFELINLVEKLFPHKQPDAISFDELVAGFRRVQSATNMFLLELGIEDAAIAQIEQKFAAYFKDDGTPAGRLYATAWERAQRP